MSVNYIDIFVTNVIKHILTLEKVGLILPLPFKIFEHLALQVDPVIEFIQLRSTPY